MNKFLNPWGATDGFNAQRSDIWSLDISKVLDIVVAHEGVVIDGNYQDLVDKLRIGRILSDVYAQKITLPEENIKTRTHTQGSQLVNFPGYDDAMSSVRIDFIHEIGDSDDTSNAAQRSTIYALLYCWLLLSSAGQTRYGRRPKLKLVNESAKPKYKADITVQFLGGTDTEESPVNTGEVSPSINGLSVATKLELIDCWISDIQLPTFDMNSEGIALITATLHCASIR